MGMGFALRSAVRTTLNRSNGENKDNTLAFFIVVPLAIIYLIYKYCCCCCKNKEKTKETTEEVQDVAIDPLNNAIPLPYTSLSGTTNSIPSAPMESSDYTTDKQNSVTHHNQFHDKDENLPPTYKDATGLDPQHKQNK